MSACYNKMQFLWECVEDLTTVLWTGKKFSHLIFNLIGQVTPEKILVDKKIEFSFQKYI